MKPIILMAIATFLISACSIKQTIDPVELHQEAKVCVINNPQVKKGFLLALEDVLEQKGINFKTVERGFDNAQCEWKVTYTANWGWDLSVYMTYAKITVYHKGKLDGKAEYDARSGGGRLDKYINADKKVRELVEELMQRKQAFYSSRKYG